MKSIFGALVVFTVSGCVTMTNLAAPDSTLNESDREAAVTMANWTTERCTKSYTRGTDTSSSKIITKAPATITRLWRGGDWYRAESRTEGIVDYVYLNKKTLSFICGSKQWDTFPESRVTGFIDVLNPKTSAATPRY